MVYQTSDLAPQHSLRLLLSIQVACCSPSRRLRFSWATLPPLLSRQHPPPPHHYGASMQNRKDGANTPLFTLPISDGDREKQELVRWPAHKWGSIGMRSRATMWDMRRRRNGGSRGRPGLARSLLCSNKLVQMQGKKLGHSMSIHARHSAYCNMRNMEGNVHF